MLSMLLEKYSAKKAQLSFRKHMKLVEGSTCKYTKFMSYTSPLTQLLNWEKIIEILINESVLQQSFNITQRHRARLLIHRKLENAEMKT